MAVVVIDFNKREGNRGLLKGWGERVVLCEDDDAKGSGIGWCVEDEEGEIFEGIGKGECGAVVGVSTEVGGLLMG